ncbi:MAG TPA: hypothetical protein VGM17_08250 [Rhizomicrobium sp.]|jgi:hypothetical protein
MFTSHPAAVSWLDHLNTFADGAAILGIGAILGFLAKEFIFPLLFESWKDRRALAEIYVRYRDPLYLAAEELANRLHEICVDYPTNFLGHDIRRLSARRLEKNSAADPYYRKYKFVSTVYRFCAFLGWLELYRSQVVFLDSGRRSQNRKFTAALHEIRSDLADGHLNANHETWPDHLIFREELRAIGEAMICQDGNENKNIMGYRRFADIYLSSGLEHERKVWFECAAGFFENPPDNTEENFRYVRMCRLFLHLVDLMSVLNESRVPQRSLKYREELSGTVAAAVS